MTPEEKSPRRIIRDKEVSERTGKSRVQRWRDVRAGKFPAPIQLGPNSIGWYEHEVERWLETRPRRTYGVEPPHMAKAESDRPEAAPADSQAA